MNAPAWFTPARTSWARDVAERVGWTAAQCALAGLTVEFLGLPGWALVPAAAGLAYVKGLVAKHVGDPQSAALGA